GQEETFTGAARRRHLDNIAFVLVEAMRPDRDVARERHDLLDAQLVVTTEQRHGGKHKPLRGVGRRQRAEREIRVLKCRNGQDVVRERVMPAFLIAGQRWHGRSCIHDLCPGGAYAAAQSIAIASSRTTRPNFARSRARNARTSWVWLGSTPWAPNEARTCGSASASAVSPCNSSTTFAGMPLGPSNTVQLSRSKSLTPASLKVGTFG